MCKPNILRKEGNMESPKFCFHNPLSISPSDHLQSLLITREHSTSGEMRATLDQFVLSLSPPSPQILQGGPSNHHPGSSTSRGRSRNENVSFFESIEIQKYKTLDWNTPQVLTRDSVTVSVDAVVYYRFAALKSRDNVFNIEMGLIPSLRFVT